MILLQLLFPFMQIAAGEPVQLQNVTYDLTGHTPIVVSDSIKGPATIIYTRVEPSDTAFLFKVVAGGVLDSNITFIGPNGNTFPLNGYMGCIRVWDTGVIQNCHFVNWDKWAIDIRGNRKTFTDTTYIRNCTFTGNKRAGYGYSIWCQYGTALIENCTFKDSRHFIDGGSEGHRVIFRNCSFDGAYQSAIHNHEYHDGYSGSGVDLINCWFGKNAINIDLEPPFPPYVHKNEGSTYWDGKATGFWIKTDSVTIHIFNGSTKIETITAPQWTYFMFRFKATIRLSGTGTAYIDDFSEPGRQFNMEESAPKIRYVSGNAKASRLNEDQVSMDLSLKLTLTDDVVEIY